MVSRGKEEYAHAPRLSQIIWDIYASSQRATNTTETKEEFSDKKTGSNSRSKGSFNLRSEK